MRSMWIVAEVEERILRISRVQAQCNLSPCLANGTYSWITAISENSLCHSYHCCIRLVSKSRTNKHIPISLHTSFRNDGLLPRFFSMEPLCLRFLIEVTLRPSLQQRSNTLPNTNDEHARQERPNSYLIVYAPNHCQHYSSDGTQNLNSHNRQTPYSLHEHESPTFFRMDVSKLKDLSPLWKSCPVCSLRPQTAGALQEVHHSISRYWWRLFYSWWGIPVLHTTIATAAFTFLRTFGDFFFFVAADINIIAVI